VKNGCFPFSFPPCCDGSGFSLFPSLFFRPPRGDLEYQIYAPYPVARRLTYHTMIGHTPVLPSFVVRPAVDPRAAKTLRICPMERSYILQFFDRFPLLHMRCFFSCPISQLYSGTVGVTFTDPIRVSVQARLTVSSSFSHGPSFAW